jgi:hypothetical protein
MRRLFGELLLHTNSQIITKFGNPIPNAIPNPIPNPIPNSLKEHGGVRGEARFPPPLR